MTNAPISFVLTRQQGALCCPPKRFTHTVLQTPEKGLHHCPSLSHCRKTPSAQFNAHFSSPVLPSFSRVLFWSQRLFLRNVPESKEGFMDSPLPSLASLPAGDGLSRGWRYCMWVAALWPAIIHQRCFHLPSSCPKAAEAARLLLTDLWSNRELQSVLKQVRKMILIFGWHEQPRS